jgi:GntR family transcriptional regulator
MPRKSGSSRASKSARAAPGTPIRTRTAAAKTSREASDGNNQGVRSRKPGPPTVPGRTGISAYRRIAAVFRRRIVTGEWQPGDRLPALDSLVEALGVGRVTVRHALDLLAEEGLIERHRDRRGSSVTHRPLDRRWFTLGLNLNELETHSADITVTEIESGRWDRPLPVGVGEGRPKPAYQRVVHLHHHRDFPYPVALTDLLIDHDVFDKLEHDTPQDRPVLERLAVQHADLGHIQQTLTIGEADIQLARRLSLPVAAPIAELRRVILDRSGAIVYFGHLFFRGVLVRLDFAVYLKR